MKYKETLKDTLKRIVKGNRFLYQVSMVLLKRKPVMNGLRKNIRGRRNKIEYSGTVILSNCKVEITGDNNRITLSDYCSFNNVTFFIRGNNNRINILENVKFKYGGSLHMEDNGCVIVIGDSCTFEDTHIAVTETGSQIVIGKDCMFAYDIDIRTGDSHSIIDTKTNCRINFAKDIYIGDHVWVAPHCSILKGVEIRKNCIVATRSVVTKTFDREGVIIGGSPCKILKENVTWDRQRILKSDQETAGHSLVEINRNMNGDR